MTELNIVALAGGVGGAKLADGLSQVLQPGQLTVVVNTADDFSHLGLAISPDLDTVCYTLAGMANQETGWGRDGESWTVMNALKQLGMPSWFNIGDTDLATHLTRTQRLGEGWSLTQVTQDFCRRWGVKATVLPMSDDNIRTIVFTDEGGLGFQEYFVHRQCKPVVNGFSFEGINAARPAPGVIEALENCDAVIICPSNPWVSIDPILAVPSISQSLKQHMVVAVSPIIGSQTVKGPAAKMFLELGFEPSALAVAQHYDHLVQAIFIDSTDRRYECEINSMGIKSVSTNILMKDKADRGRFAYEVLNYISGSIERVF